MVQSTVKPTLVKKFGGTSVGSIERIRAVAERVTADFDRGQNVVVVVSAMSGETNRLVGLAEALDKSTDSPEYDLLIASGEQVAVGLVTMAINRIRRDLAVPLLGHQLGIQTDSVFSKARIHSIDTTKITEIFSAGKLAVVAGFQGVDIDNRITTLGRGGSDTTAVAIAAALGGCPCEIFTDVDGIYTTDPRLCPTARKLEAVTYEEMMELASQGAKVLQIRSVELAAQYRVPLEVLSSFSDARGTKVVSQELMKSISKLPESLERVSLSGVAADLEQVRVTLEGLPNRSDVIATVFGVLSDAAIVVDVIVQNHFPHNPGPTLAFTIHERDGHKAQDVLNKLKSHPGFDQLGISVQTGLAKISLVGVGMQHHHGVASKMFRILADNDITIELVSTSEIKISVLISRTRTQAAVSALHQGFGLDEQN